MSANLLLASLDEVLLQGECLLSALSDEQYASRIPEALNASIGAHYRHNLEHFKTMFGAVSEPAIDYDQRARDVRIENERLFALEVTKSFRHTVQFLTASQLERTVLARVKTSYVNSGQCSAASTVGREIMYVISHAVHHYALIALICGMRNIPLPKGFGIAPSTIQYQKQSASS